jgi:hypothetical protein
VVVEPNPAYQARLRRYRPHDVIVEAGVGITDDVSTIRGMVGEVDLLRARRGIC